MGRDLTKLEKNLLNYSIKNEMAKKRRAWRICVEEIRGLRFKVLKHTRLEAGTEAKLNITFRKGQV